MMEKMEQDEVIHSTDDTCTKCTSDASGMASVTGDSHHATPRVVEFPMDQSGEKRCTDEDSKCVGKQNQTNENAGTNKVVTEIKKKTKGSKADMSKKPKVINIEDYPESYETEEYMLVNPIRKGKSDTDRTALRYACKLCNSYRTTDPHALQKHLSLHLAGKLNCEFCDFVASTYNLLVSHQRRLHMNDIKRDFACSQCEFKARNKITLDDHYGKIHNKPSHCCKFCKSEFTTMNNMKEHRLNQHSDSTWQCSKCREIFLAERGYKQHMVKKVCERKEVTCDVCGCVCPHVLQLKEHIRRIHAQEHNLKCEMCPYTTGNSDLLKNHVRAQHLKIHPYRCKECPFSCVKAWQLTSHSRTHSGLRPYKCDACKYDCSWNVQLKKHKKVHESVTQQRCDKCDIVFANVTSFNKHIRKVHHDDETVNFLVTDNSCKQTVSKAYVFSSNKTKSTPTSHFKLTHKVNNIETDEISTKETVIKEQVTRTLPNENGGNLPSMKKPEIDIVENAQANGIEPETVGLTNHVNVCEAAGSPYEVNMTCSGEKADVSTETDIADWKRDIMSLNHLQLCKRNDSQPQPVQILRNVFTKHDTPQVIKIRKPELINECKKNSRTQLQSQREHTKPVTGRPVSRKSKSSAKSRKSKASVKSRKSKASLKIGKKCNIGEIEVCVDMPLNTVLNSVLNGHVQSKSLLKNMATPEMPIQASTPQKQLPTGVKFFIYPKKSDGHCLTEGKEFPLTLYEVNPETTVDPFGNVTTQLDPTSDSVYLGMEQMVDMDVQDGISILHTGGEQKDVAMPTGQYSQNGASKETGYTLSNPLSVRTSCGVITLYNNLSAEDAQYFPNRMDVGGSAVSCVGDNDTCPDTVVIQMQDENGYNGNTDVLANLQSGDWIAAPVSIGENITDQSVLEYLSSFPLTETSGTSLDRNSNSMHENMSSHYDKQFTNLDEATNNLECENSMDDMLETCSIQCMQMSQNCVDRALDGSDSATLTSCDEESLFTVQDIVCDSSYDVMNL